MKRCGRFCRSLASTLPRLVHASLRRLFFATPSYRARLLAEALFRDGRSTTAAPVSILGRSCTIASLPLSGELILITDDCFPITAREPFFGRGETLREFLTEAPFVFDGDAIFIWPESRRITVFDHEGTFAHIDCHDDAA